MVKLFKLSGIQKITTIVCIGIILVGMTFGILTKCTFSRLSEEKTSYDNAKLYFDEQTALYIDEMYNKTSFEEALLILDEYDYIFKVKCISSEHCYQCTKFNAEVTDTVKGVIDETGNEIVLYQWVSFEETDDGVFAFNSPDNSLLLKEGNEYLVFCQKRDYYPEYQKKLNCNEYSIALTSSVPSAYLLNKYQQDYIDLSKDTTYSDIEDLSYACFSKESLSDINKLSEKIIDHYCPE